MFSIIVHHCVSTVVKYHSSFQIQDGSRRVRELSSIRAHDNAEHDCASVQQYRAIPHIPDIICMECVSSSSGHYDQYMTFLSMIVKHCISTEPPHLPNLVGCQSSSSISYSMRYNVEGDRASVDQCRNAGPVFCFKNSSITLFSSSSKQYQCTIFLL